jgi:hypothetical protein
MFPFALRREILLLLAVKAALLTALYLLFFAHPTSPTPAAIGAHLTGISP